MNKKFLSAILFGALMVSSTGTFVSCKDYDDDIDELWGAVNGGKEELSKKVSALETSVSDLQGAQTKLEAEIAAVKKEAAYAKADSDQAAADAADAKAAALQAEKNAIEAAKAEIAKVKEELVKMIQDNQGASEEDIKAIESEIATIKGDIAALTAAYKGADAEILDKLSKVESTLGERISNLEADVKTNKEEIGKLQGALKLQQDALDAYKEATGKELGDINTRLAACEEAVKALQGFDVAETKAAIEQLKNDYKKIAEEITKINTNLDVLSSAIYTGVTHVSLVNSENNNQGEDKWNLDFESVLIQKNIFGDEWTLDKTIANKLEFKGGTQDQKSAKFLIRVSPTNANLDASMISLQDSKGEKLDIVEVKNITPYDELLTGTRGISKGGLWVVEVALKNYDEDSFNAAADKDGKKVESWTSTDKPHMVEKLPVGEYTLREEQAPDGYLIAEDVKFTVKDTGKVQKVKMKDAHPYGKLVIKKTDSTSKAALSGAEFELREKESGKVVEKLVTDKTGTATSGKLPIATYKNGKVEKTVEYILVETKAPNGYELSSKKEEIRFEYKDGKTKVIEIVKEIKNTKSPSGSTPTGNSPKTGDSTNIWLPILLAVLSACGIGGVIWYKKKKGN